MRRLLSDSWAKRVWAAALIPIFSACAFAPGMKVDHKPADKPGVALPAPDIQLITPDLIQAERAHRAQQPVQDISPLLGTPQPYTIGPSDILSILVWNHPELSAASAAPNPSSAGTAAAHAPAGFVVDHNGMVQFPLAGLVKLGGLTEVQARSLLREKLLVQLRNPDITLRVQNYRSRRVFVDGEVIKPGNQVIDDVPMTLLETLSRAGGFAPTADQSDVSIIRDGKSYRINLSRLLDRGLDPSKIMLIDGDTVRVGAREDSKVYVLGEVIQPKALPMHHGRMTLSQALGEVGGVNPLSAEARQIYVIRNSTSKTPLVYNLDARSPVALALADQFELNARDVVYVDTAEIARLNRVIGLIIPSAGVVTSTLGGVR